MNKKWYQKSWFMWIMLFLFFPVGFFLLWKYSDYSKKAKIIITAIFIVLIIIGSSGNKGENNTSTQPATKQEQTTSQQPQKKAEPSVPVEYKNALRKAETYGKTMHMSKAGIYKQLTSEYGEKFSAEAAQYAIDNVKLDYKKEALAKAKQYQSQQAMSRNAVYDQLVSPYGEHFTEEEAQYAVDHLNN